MTHSDSKPNAKIRKVEDAIRAYALAYPETHEDYPWGECALKVKGKVFVFMRADATGFGCSVKLKESHVEALDLPFTEPTHYGLGKHGWVSCSFEPNDKVPVALLKLWVDESFRAVAPKSLLKQLRTAEESAAKPASAVKARAPVQKPKKGTKKPPTKRAKAR